HGLGYATGIDTLALHTQNRVHAVIHDVIDDTQQHPLAGLSAVNGAPDEVDPIIFVVFGGRKRRTRDPHGTAPQRFGLIAVGHALETGDDRGAMTAAFRHPDGPWR